MSANSKIFIDEVVTITGSANSCEFINCPKVKIDGSCNNSKFSNCSKIEIFGSCNNTKFHNCANIAIGGSCNNSKFTNCADIIVGGSINNCTRDGKPYGKGGSSSFSSYVSFGGGGGGGTIISGSGNRISTAGGGNIIINGVSYSGSGTLINNVWVPTSMRFSEAGGRADGRVYGKRGDTWYVYDPSKGSSKSPDSWIHYEPKEYYDVPQHQRNDDSSAPPAEPGVELYQCIQCRVPGAKLKEMGSNIFYCSKECQELDYKKKNQK